MVGSLWNDLPWFHYIFQIQWRIISTGAWVVKDPQVEWLMRYELLKYNHRAIYLVFENHILWAWSEAFGFARNCLCFVI